MKTVDEINKICTQHHMVRMTVSSYPTWVDQQKQEGVELKNGINSFWIIEGERLYSEPPSNHIVLLLEALQDSEKKPEIIEIPKSIKPIESTTVWNRLPEICEDKQVISFRDVEDLKKMSVYDRILMFQHTPARLVKTKNGRGGKQSYVEGNVMKMEANIAFLWKISSHIDSWTIDETGVSCAGSITVNIDGETITVSAVGLDLQEFRKDSKEPVFTVHELKKNAWTDCRKKMLADMGFNGDVYRGEV